MFYFTCNHGLSRLRIPSLRGPHIVKACLPNLVRIMGTTWENVGGRTQPVEDDKKLAATFAESVLTLISQLIEMGSQFWQTDSIRNQLAYPNPILRAQLNTSWRAWRSDSMNSSRHRWKRAITSVHKTSFGCRLAEQFSVSRWRRSKEGQHSFWTSCDHTWVIMFTSRSSWIHRSTTVVVWRFPLSNESLFISLLPLIKSVQGGSK